MAKNPYLEVAEKATKPNHLIPKALLKQQTDNPYLAAAKNAEAKPKTQEEPFLVGSPAYQKAVKDMQAANPSQASPKLAPTGATTGLDDFAKTINQREVMKQALTAPALSTSQGQMRARKVTASVPKRDPWQDFPFTRNDLQNSLDLGLSHVQLKGSTRYIGIDAAMRQVVKRLGPTDFHMSKSPGQVEQEFHERGNQNIETPDEKGRRTFLEKKKAGSDPVHNAINESPVFQLLRGAKALASDIPNVAAAAAMSVPGSHPSSESRMSEGAILRAIHQKAKTSPGAVMFQYLMPFVGQVHMAGDAGTVAGTSIEQRSLKPTVDAVKEIVRGAVFWEPGIGTEERFVRVINAALMAKGVLHAAKAPGAVDARRMMANRVADRAQSFFLNASRGNHEDAVQVGVRDLGMNEPQAKATIAHIQRDTQNTQNISDPPVRSTERQEPTSIEVKPEPAETQLIEQERRTKITTETYGRPGEAAWPIDKLMRDSRPVQRKNSGGSYAKLYPSIVEHEGGYWVEGKRFTESGGTKVVMRPALAEDFAPGASFDPQKIIPGLVPPLTETIKSPKQTGDTARQFDRVRVSAEGQKFLETRADPRTIEVYPGLQYKRAGIVDNQNAITDELKNVTKYDQATAGPLTVWETKDGRRFVMNGHHRRELAIRTGEPDVPIRVFREDDGVDFRLARAYGALQNLRDAKGTAIDMATVLRDLNYPASRLQDLGINTRSGIARDAISLLKLDIDSLRYVEEGQVKEAVAAGIADAGLDSKRTAAVLKLAARSDLETRSQGALLADRARSVPMVDRSGGNGDLFGEIDEGLALAEQAKLADNAMRRLSQSQRALSAFNKAKAVGSTFIDAEAQNQAAAIQEFGRKVIATDAEAARVLEQEAANYARNPTKRQLEDSTTAIVRAAEDAAERRLAELRGQRPGLGQDPNDSVPGRTGSGQEPPAGLLEVEPELTLQPDKGISKPKTESVRTDPNPVGKQLTLDPEGMGDKSGQLGLGFDSKRAQDAQVKGERIPWKAEPGGFDGQLSDLILDLGGIPDRRILQGKRKKVGASGTYYPGTAQTTIRRWNDLDVAAHETAHALDDKFGLVSDWAMDGADSPFDGELQWFWERGGSGGPDKPLIYNRAEGVAEFIRSYLVNPEIAAQRAPEFASHMKSVLPPEAMSRLEATGKRLRQWYGSTPIEKTRAAIRTDKAAGAGLVERVKDFFDPNRQGEGFATSGIDKARMLATDEMAPFVTAAKEAAKRRGFNLDRLRPSNNPVILARGLSYFPQRFESVVEFGMTDKTGKPVTPPANFLLRSLDRTNEATLKADLKDLESLLVSERTNEKATHIADEGMQRLAEIEQSLTDRMNERIEKLEGSLRRNFELQYQRKLGEILAKAKMRRAEGKALSADAHNRRNKRIESNIERQKAGIRAKHELEIQTQLDRIRAREQENLKMRMERAARVVERVVTDRQSRLTGAGGGVLNATEIALGTIDQLQANPQRYARLSVAAAAYRQWSDAVLQYMVEKGRISAQSYAQIKSRNQQYAAMQRFLDDAEHVDLGGRAGMAGAKEVVKEFTGSTATIDSPLANLLRNTFAAMKEADRNEVMASFVKLLSSERGMYEGKPTNLAAIGQRVSAGTAGAVRVFVKGEPQYWLLEEGIDKAVRGMGKVTVPNWIGKSAQFLTNALRKGVTVMPGFQVRNRIRDIEHTMLVSPHHFKPADWLNKASLEERRLYDFFGGGIGRGHYLDGATDFFDVRDRLIDEMRLDKRSIMLDPRRLVQSYEEAMKRSEMAPRISEMRAAEREASHRFRSEYDKKLYSAQSARNLIDFAQGGSITKFMSRYMVPFVNAQVQGQRSLANMAADHPTKFATRWISTIMIPHLAVYAWNRMQGDQNLEEYRQLPAYQRDMFYNLKVGDNLWIRIPKPYEAGVVGSGLERTIDSMFGNQDAFEGYGGSLAKSFLPVDEGMIQGYGLSPVAEAISNRDSFRDKAIVPAHEDQLALELRKYDKDASRIGQWIQEGLGIDSRKADHLVRGFLGEAGSMALFVSDLGRDDKPVRKHAALNRVFGTFAGSPGMSSPIVNDVLESARQAGVQENPLGDLIDDYFDAETDREADIAAKNLRDAAGALRIQYQLASKGKEGAAKWEAIRGVLAKSSYRRERKSGNRKLPERSKSRAPEDLGIPNTKADPLGIGSMNGEPGVGKKGAKYGPDMPADSVPTMPNGKAIPGATKGGANDPGVFPGVARDMAMDAIKDGMSRANAREWYKRTTGLDADF